MSTPTLVSVSLVLLTVAACGGREEPGRDDWPSAEARRMQPGHAPTPFTADQIREACPVGRTSVFRIELDGHPPFLQTFHFTAADAEGAELTITNRDEDGRLRGEVSTSHSTWKGFQAHASWPAEHTTITEVEETVPAGTFRGFLYRVESDGNVVEAFFARDLPGPPVRMVRSRDGRPEMTMTLVSHQVDG